MPERSPVPAFVLGLSTAGLAAVRSLGRAGVPVIGFAQNDVQAGFTSRYCTAHACADPVHAPDALLEQLVSAARPHGRPVLFCTSDEFVSFACARRDEVERAFRVTIPSPEIAELALDKRKQYEAAARLGVPHPASFYPETREEVRRVAGEVDYPAFVKPYESHLWREQFEGTPTIKGIKVRSPAELVSVFDQVLARGLRTLVQSIVEGPATDLVELYAYTAADGEVLAQFSVRKLRQFPVEFGTGTLVESYETPDLADPALRLLRGLGYRGFAAVEFKRDARDGQLKLIELNPRLVLQCSLASDCGVDFPLLEYRDLLGERPRAQRGFTTGVRWWDAPRDLKAFLSARGRGELTLASWIRSCLTARSFANFAADDVGPFAYSYMNRLERAARSSGVLRALHRRAEEARGLAAGERALHGVARAHEPP